MYAVIMSGGKQYKVAPGDVVRVESLEGQKGDKVEIKDVCMIVDGDTMSVGKPTLESAMVTAEVVEQGRGEKLIIFKHRGYLPISPGVNEALPGNTIGLFIV